ncbi:MAG: diol dehydratase small subunit [Acidimicrobiia bacterium]
MPPLEPSADYPLGTRRPDLIKTPSGAALEDINLDQLRAGVIAGEDIRATSETLLLQAEIAAATGRDQLAENLRRAAELTRVPDDVVLAVYTALRPGRSTATALEDWAVAMETEFRAPSVAAFIREAKAVYLNRGLVE